MARVRIKGLDRVVKGIAGAERKYRDALRAKALQVTAPVKRAAARYPKKRPRQQYKRTYKLRRGWTESIPNVQSLPGLVEIGVTNVVEYSDDVQTAGKQKPIFADRWSTTDQIAAEQAAPTAAVVDGVISKVKVL